MLQGWLVPHPWEDDVKRWVVVLCGLWALGLVGCGGDALCERWADVRQGAVEKIGSCSGVEASSGDGAMCEDASSKCGSEGSAKLNAYFACMEKVAACEGGKELAFVGAQAQCQAELGGLTAECAAQFGINGSSISGRMTVEVSGPRGLSARVTLKGPGGYNKQVSGSVTLADLTPGEYTVEAAEVRATYPVGEEILGATVSPNKVTVTPGKAALVTVRYSADPRTSRLWQTHSYANSILGFDPSALASAPPASDYFVEPSVVLRAKGLRIYAPEAFARDPAGDVWVVSCQEQQVVKVRSADLLQSGAPIPVVAVDLSSATKSRYVCPAGIAFDAEGTLWLSIEQSLVGYSAQQLAQGGRLVPAFQRTLSGFILLRGLTFDAAGNLWAASYSGEVLMFAPAQLHGTGAILPTRFLRVLDNSLGESMDLAFVGGDLWVAGKGTRNLVRFSAEQVAAGGVVTPAATLSNPELMTAPHSLAVDASGNLWVGADGGDFSTTPPPPGRLVRLPPSELKRIGKVTASPDVVLTEGEGMPHDYRGLLFMGGDLLVASPYFQGLFSAQLVRLGASQLVASGTPAPLATFSAAEVSFESPEHVAFDAQGALWVVSCNTSSLVKYASGTWGVSGRPTPALTLRLRDVYCPRALAFDLQGNLWVGSNYTVQKFPPSRLQGSGDATPELTITLAADDSQFSAVQALAFDTANTLWVIRANSTLEAFAASVRVTSSSSPAPTVRLSLPPSQFGTSGSRLAFDNSGALFVSVPNANQVLRYAAEQLSVSGAPAPRVVTVPYYPIGMAFDRQGHLWVSCSSVLVRLAPADLLNTGEPSPELSLPLFGGGGSIAFSPALP